MLQTKALQRVQNELVAVDNSGKLSLRGRCHRHAKMYSTLVPVNGNGERRCFRCLEARLLTPADSSIEPLLLDDLNSLIFTTNLTDEDSQFVEYRHRLHRMLYRPNESGYPAGAGLLSELSRIVNFAPSLAKAAGHAMLCIVKLLKADHLRQDLIIGLASTVVHILEPAQIFIIQLVSEAYNKEAVAAVDLLPSLPSLLEVSHAHDITSCLGRLSADIVDINEQYASLVAEAFLAGVQLDNEASPSEETIHIISLIASQRPAIVLPPSTDLLITLIDVAASRATIVFVCDTLRIVARALKSARFVGQHGIEMRLSEIVCLSVDVRPVLVAMKCLRDLAVSDPSFADEGRPAELFNRMVDILRYSWDELQVMILDVLLILVRGRGLERIQPYYVELLFKFLRESLSGEDATVIKACIRLAMELLPGGKLPEDVSAEACSALLLGCVEAHSCSKVGIDLVKVLLCTNEIVEDYIREPSEGLGKLVEDLVTKVLSVLSRDPEGWTHKDRVLSLISCCCQAVTTTGAPTRLWEVCGTLGWCFLDNCFEADERRSYTASLVCSLDARQDVTDVYNCIAKISDENLRPAEVCHELFLSKLDQIWTPNATDNTQKLSELLNQHAPSWGNAFLSKATIIKRLLIDRPTWAAIIVNVLETEPPLLHEVTLDADSARRIFPHIFDLLSHHWESGDRIQSIINHLISVAATLSVAPDNVDFLCVKLARLYQTFPLLDIISLLLRLLELESRSEISTRTISLLSEESPFVDELIARSSTCLVCLKLLYTLSNAVEAGKAKLVWSELKKRWNVMRLRERTTSSNLISLILFETLKQDSPFVLQPQPSLGEFREAWQCLLETTDESLFRAALSFIDRAAPSWMWDQTIFELVARLLQITPENFLIPKVLTALLLQKCIPHRTFDSMKWAGVAERWLAAVKDDLPADLWQDCSNGLKKLRGHIC